MITRKILIGLFCMNALCLFAQDTFVVASKIDKHYKGLIADKQQQIYLFDDEGITRYNNKGEKLKEFKHTENAPITAIAVNPAGQMIVLFAESDLLLVYDKNFIQIGRLELNAMGIEDAQACYYAPDGMVGIYDGLNQAVIKANFNGSLNRKEIQLFDRIKGEKKCAAMEESGANIYFLDTAVGIIIYDVYGKQKETIDAKGIQSIQVVNQKLIYIENNAVVVRNLLNQERTSVQNIRLEKGCKHAVVFGEQLVTGNGEALYIYIRRQEVK